MWSGCPHPAFGSRRDSPRGEGTPPTFEKFAGYGRTQTGPVFFRSSQTLDSTVCSADVNENKPVWPVASLAILTGLNLLDYLDRQLLSAVLPPLQKELGLLDEQAGTIATGFMLGYFL